VQCTVDILDLNRSCETPPSRPGDRAHRVDGPRDPRRARLVGGAPLASGAPPATPHRIGVLDVVATAANEANLATFRQGLRELGYEVIP
jgi:hypothetical protein